VVCPTPAADRLPRIRPGGQRAYRTPPTPRARTQRSGTGLAPGPRSRGLPGPARGAVHRRRDHRGRIG
jgi:hypothetical protein